MEPGNRILLITVPVCAWSHCVHEYFLPLICNAGITDSAEPTSTCNVVTSAVVSSISTFLVTSVIIFIVGFVCGHCFGQRYKRPAKETSGTIVQGEHSRPICDPNFTYLPKMVKQEEQDLELKENVAYLTLSSTTV